ncbi:MAG TPA: PilN domain-containing protein [Myxococcota bacterium]|nr:PilN domain-containing protein [Myxococcota bacterium]
MIDINLLPVREARRKADVRQLGMQVLLALILGAASIGFVHSHVVSRISESEERIRQMEADIKQFQPQLDQVAAFRKKKASLEKKIEVIEDLDRARTGPVRVMSELATHMPDRVWLTNLTTDGNAIKMKGEGMDNELVAVLMRALKESPYFDDVDLQGTELGNSKQGLKLVKFNIEATVASPKPAKPADAPGKPGKAAAKAKGKGGAPAPAPASAAAAAES